jgi:hypothetical protein
MPVIELCFTDLITCEIVSGYCGATIQCQWSRRKTQTVKWKRCKARARLKVRANAHHPVPYWGEYPEVSASHWLSECRRAVPLEAGRCECAATPGGHPEIPSPGPETFRSLRSSCRPRRARPDWLAPVPRLPPACLADRDRPPTLCANEAEMGSLALWLTDSPLEASPVGLLSPTLDWLLVERAIYKASSFQLARSSQAFPGTPYLCATRSLSPRILLDFPPVG